jgi:hypothetical protein
VLLFVSSPMGKGHQHEEWTQDVATRQRNIVFPDTVQSEARFWRNLGNLPFTTAAKVGFGLLALFVFGTAASWLGMLIRYDHAWKQEVVSIVAATLLVFWAGLLGYYLGDPPQPSEIAAQLCGPEAFHQNLVK